MLDGGLPLRREVEQVGRFEAHKLPSGEVVYFDPEPHRYYTAISPSAKSKGGFAFKRGSQMTGVSTPTKCLDTNVDPLLWWAAKLDQTGIADLATIELDAGGDLEWLREQASIAAALREAGLTWADVRNKAAERGTQIHKDIFLALSQDERPPSLASLSDEDRGYGQSALKWWRDRKPVPILAEQVTAATDIALAGRPDLLCTIDGARVLVDAKTRERGAQRRSDHVQLRGYERCNVACGYGPSDAQLVLILTPWGDPIEVPCVADNLDFAAALNAYRRGTDLQKRMDEAWKLATA